MNAELRALDAAIREACFALQVRKAQRAYIASNADSWQTAQENAQVARPFGIWVDGQIVGFTMFAFDEAYEDPDNRYWLWRLMIGEEHQGKGYGRLAMEAIIRYFRAHGAGHIRLSTKADNAAALALYRSFGFRETGEMNGEEIVLNLVLAE